MSVMKKMEHFARRHFGWIVAGGVLAAAVTCLTVGLQQSVWFDEAYSVLVAKQPIPELLRLVAADTHPPLYYLLLHGWMGLFGSGEMALRLLSVLAYGGSLALTSLFMRRRFGVRAGLLTLGLLAVSPLLMRYGFEIRMYSLAGLIGIAATCVMVKARGGDGARWWVLYALLVAVGMATLYNLAYLWLAHAVWLLLSDRRAGNLSWRVPWLKAYAGSIVLFLPQLPTVVVQMTNGSLAPISQPMTLENMLSIVTFNTVYQPVWGLNATVSLVVLAVLAALVSLAVWGWQKALVRHDGWLVLMYLWLPVAVLTLVCLLKPLYVERYLSHVALGFAMSVSLLAAVVSRRYPRRAAKAYGVVLAASCLGVITLAATGNFNFQRMQTPNVREVASRLDCRRGGVVMAADPYVATELQYYVEGRCPVYFQASWNDLKGGYAPYNHSVMQIKNEQIPALSSIIYYAHYGESKLALPAGYGSSIVVSGSDMRLEKLSAE